MSTAAAAEIGAWWAVAAPLGWAELSRLADAPPDTIKTIARRPARRGDPWKDIARRARAIREAEQRLDTLEAGLVRAPPPPRLRRDLTGARRAKAGRR